MIAFIEYSQNDNVIEMEIRLNDCQRLGIVMKETLWKRTVLCLNRGDVT